MTKHKDLKKHFEAILGWTLEEADLFGEFVIALRERTASYSFDEGFVTSREIGTTGNSTKACSAANLLDVAGIARTGRDGSAEFMLSDFGCISSISYEFPVNFVATPRTTSPVFLTAFASPTNDRRDVTIRVTSWDSSGSPAPNVSFNWRCRVPYSVIIL